MAWGKFDKNFCLTIKYYWAMVGAQLIARLLPTPEFRGSNPDVGISFSVTNCIVFIEKTKIKEQEATHLKKNY